MSETAAETPTARRAGPSAAPDALAREAIEADDATHVDGRRRRRAHNRTAVIDAMVELFAEGVYRPSSQEVAQRAGLSPRSLFRYFTDTDDLHRAAIERQLAVAAPLVEVEATPGDDTAVKIERVVASRVRLFEAIAPAARAARASAYDHPVVARQVTSARRHLRQQLEALFEPELAARAAEDRDQLEPALDVLCSFEAYELLRHSRQLSEEQASRVLRAALILLLTPPAPAAPRTRGGGR